MNMEKFIQSVHGRPCLWNRLHKHHHNRFVLEKEWDDLAKECKITRDVARSKWKSLRDKFRLELSRVAKEMMCDPEINYDSVSWTHFKSLLFLKDQFSDKKHYETMILDGEQDSLDEKNDDSSQNYVYISVPSPAASNENKNTSPLSPESTSSNPGSKRLKTDSAEQMLVHLEMQKIKLFNEWKDMIQNEGEEMQFFRSIAVYVKDLPPLEKINFRMKVLKAVQEALTDQSA